MTLHIKIMILLGMNKLKTVKELLDEIHATGVKEQKICDLLLQKADHKMTQSAVSQYRTGVSKNPSMHRYLAIKKVYGIILKKVKK